MLTLNNVVKEYKNITAVNGISAEIEPGKVFGLLGPNGAGKTTTIRMILNIIKPTSGQVLYNGNAISSDFFNISGYLPEERGLYKKSKVIDIIKYFAMLKGLTSAEAETNAMTWLNRFDIAGYKTKKLEELSKGNQQKIQFIIAVVHNPQIIIFDEPFSGFDPVNQELAANAVIELAGEGKTIILSTHQMDTAEKLCGSIFLINKGKEVLSGSIAEIKKSYGTNKVRLEFTGGSEKIEKLPALKSFEIFDNYAELTLEQDVNISEYIRTVASEIDLKGFALIEPSLHQIFIDTIGRGKEN